MKDKSQLFIDNQVFITTTQACRYLSVKRHILYGMADNGTLTWHKENGSLYFSKKEIISLKAHFEVIRDNYYASKDAANLMNKALSSVQSMCSESVLPNHLLMFRKLFILKKDVDNYVKQQADLSEKYYTTEEASDILNINIQALRRLIKNNQFPNMLIFKNKKCPDNPKRKKYYIPKSEVHAYKNENEYIIDDGEYLTIPEIIKTYHICRLTLMNTVKFPNSKRLDNSRFSYKISKKDVEAYLHRKEYLKNNQFIENSDVAYNFFLKETENLSAYSLYPETSKLFTSFVFYQLKKSKARNKKKDVREFLIIYNSLLNSLHKEIYLYTDNDINFFLRGKNISLSYGNNFANFLKYCKSAKRNDCLFTAIPVMINNHNPKEAREIISPNIFFQYRKYITDLEYHIPKAIQKPRHVQIWLFVTMHLFEAWRAGDVVSIPNIDLNQIKVLDFDYFSNNPNGLSITQAEIILKQYYVHEFIINKTGSFNNFYVPNSFVIPFSTALVLAEIHRRNNNQNCIMYNFQIRYPSKRDYLYFFKDKKELAIFSNLRICRTLLSLYYEWVSEKSELQGLAHEMSRRLRGHIVKEEDLFLTDTTSIYIQDVNNEEKNRNFSKHIFDRGSFGWLYHTLLLLLADDTGLQHISLEDKTDLIISIQDKQSPFQIEGLGKSLLQQQERRKTLLNELLNMPKENLLIKIQKIYEGIMPSKIPEAQCLKYGECPYPKSQTFCKRCKYLIPNKYFLISLKNEIYDLFKSYENIINNEAKALLEGRALNLESEKLKIRQILWDYMTLLQEALNEEHGLGRETVEAFIDLKALWEDLGKIQ